MADRKTLDPPPIVQLTVQDGDPQREWLQSPFFFMCANLFDPVLDTPIAQPPSETLAGTLVSSLHRVRDDQDREGGYFVFGDLSVKLEGQFRLQFSLFEMLDGAQVEFITSTVSAVFTVYSAKLFPGVLESTVLSRQFSDQGVRLRLRKETGARAASFMRAISTEPPSGIVSAAPSPLTKRGSLPEQSSRRKRSHQSSENEEPPSPRILNDYAILPREYPPVYPAYTTPRMQLPQLDFRVAVATRDRDGHLQLPPLVFDETRRASAWEPRNNLPPLRGPPDSFDSAAASRNR